jgi:aspartate/tyrosine/aromatic aminotransferase
MAAVRAADQQRWQQQDSKAYLGLAGNGRFLDAVMQLALPADRDAPRWTAIQTPGASGALRLMADLIASSRPGSTVWISDPSYVNHAPIMRAAGLAVQTYPYLDPVSGGVRRDAMFDELAGLGQNDVLLLHGCCHNPSGADLSPADWQRLAGMASRQGFTPLVDLAYQGFGEGLHDDVAGLATLTRAVEQMMVVYSCSKHFGLYRERTGAALVLSRNADVAGRLRGRLFELVRRSYSMAPDYGAELVARIVQTPTLYEMWCVELDTMRQRIVASRHALADALARRGVDGERLRHHRGMFSMLPLDAAQLAHLREAFAVYAVAGGRINLAGLSAANVERVAESLATVLAR